VSPAAWSFYGAFAGVILAFWVGVAGAVYALGRGP
jgi:hypothetical protein